jgi:2-amino-4-hydroxy-6-hydroxymethyldihydropteridine diphosphokinase
MILLGLGTNQGDSLGLLVQAKNLLQTAIGGGFLYSSIYQTKAWGTQPDQPDYLNQVLAVLDYPTNLQPLDVLSICQRIEHQLGRNRALETHWGARTMDIDMLFFEQRILLTPQLELPHPRLHLRNFVLQPLLEICPDFVHPVLRASIRELAKACPDKLEVAVILSKP